MKLARFEVSSELLCHLLRLPEDVKIVDIRNCRTFGDGVSAEISCVSETFEDVDDGQPVPVKSPLYRTDGNGSFEFAGWQNVEA